MMTAKQKAARAKFKAVVKEAQKLRKKNPKLTQAQAVKQAWAISYSKQRAGKKLGAAKKATPTKVKAKKSKRTSEMHTDTKSHNVNIRVVSGIGSIKKTAETLLKNQYGHLAAKKLTESTKRGKSKIAKQMRDIASKIRKIEHL